MKKNVVYKKSILSDFQTGRRGLEKQGAAELLTNFKVYGNRIKHFHFHFILVLKSSVILGEI